MAHNTILVDGVPSTKHPLYKTWKGMRARCYYDKHKDYHLYGGRGIRVCERWVSSFPNFVFDMGVRPPKKTLDRINGNEDYSPENCRWADVKTQNNNQRKRRTGFIKGAYKNNSTKERGIYLLPNGKYRVQVWIGGKATSGGCHSTIEEAVAARTSLGL